MKEQRIVIDIDREGRITAESDGFSGDTCIETLGRLLDGLAPGTASIERKPETNPPTATRKRGQLLRSKG